VDEEKKQKMQESKITYITQNPPAKTRRKPRRWGGKKKPMSNGGSLPLNPKKGLERERGKADAQAGVTHLSDRSKHTLLPRSQEEERGQGYGDNIHGYKGVSNIFQPVAIEQKKKTERKKRR